MINLITQRDEKGVQRARGYATVEYSSTIEDENIIKITEENLASIFETAKSNGETLDGAASSIDAAIDDPLSYIDYLILDTNDSIAFDPDHVREDQTAGSTSS